MEVTSALPFPIRDCLESEAPVISRRCANGIAIPELFCDRLLALDLGASREAAAAHREDRLLRENEGAIGESGLRAACAQVRSRQAMLRPLRLLSGGRSRPRHRVRLSADRPRDFRRLHFFRANPLAATSCSPAARLIRFESRRLVSRLRARLEGNSRGGSHEISLIDHSGSGAGRHSERDFAFG
jgi:hypothetical protein